MGSMFSIYFSLFFCILLLGLMDVSTLEDGKLASNMGKVHFIHHRDRKRRVSGKMVNEKDG